MKFKFWTYSSYRHKICQVNNKKSKVAKTAFIDSILSFLIFLPYKSSRTWTYAVSIEPYVDEVLGYLISLFNINIDHKWSQTHEDYRVFDISTEYHPFEIKKECMRLEEQDGKRISDIDIDVCYGTADCLEKSKKVSRWDLSFIRWRMKNYFRELTNRFT